MSRPGGTTAQAVVPVHDDEGPSLAAMLWALALGCASALLVYTGAGLLSLAEDTGAPPPWTFGVFFIGGWMLSAWALAWRTRRAIEVVTRGLLLGTCEWLGLAGLGLFVPEDVVSALGRDAAARPGTWLMGQWLSPLVQGLTPMVMALTCFVAFVAFSMLCRLLLPEIDRVGTPPPLRVDDDVPQDPSAA